LELQNPIDYLRSNSEAPERPNFLRGANLRQKEEEDKMKRPPDLEAKIFWTL
jgi:hypothetical protein